MRAICARSIGGPIYGYDRCEQIYASSAQARGSATQPRTSLRKRLIGFICSSTTLPAIVGEGTVVEGVNGSAISKPVYSRLALQHNEFDRLPIIVIVNYDFVILLDNYRINDDHNNNNNNKATKATTTTKTTTTTTTTKTIITTAIMVPFAQRCGYWLPQICIGVYSRYKQPTDAGLVRRFVKSG